MLKSNIGEKNMRQQDKVIMWPAYFDSTRTRKDGRRTAKGSAIPVPRISEIREAAERLHLNCELVPDAGYAKMPWLKPGMLLIKKNKEPKEEIIKKIAAQLLKNRNTNTPKQS